MIRTFELSATAHLSVAPDTKPATGPTDLRDPGGRGFVAEWLRHVEAGRIGGNPPMSEEAIAAVLANERVICGGGG